MQVDPRLHDVAAFVVHADVVDLEVRCQNVAASQEFSSMFASPVNQSTEVSATVDDEQAPTAEMLSRFYCRQASGMSVQELPIKLCWIMTISLLASS